MPARKNKNKRSFSLTPLNSTLIITLLLLILYGHSFSYPLDKLDENVIITDHLELLKNPSNFNKIITSDPFFNDQPSSFYRPLQNLSFMIDAMAGNGNPLAFHLSAFILFILSLWLLFHIFRISGIDMHICFGATLLFAVHPFLVQTVVWIPSRGDLLMAVFTLTAIISLLNFLNHQNKLFLLLHFFSIAAGLLSKESSLAIIPVSILFLFHKKITSKTIIGIVTVYLLMIGCFFLLRHRLSIGFLPVKEHLLWLYRGLPAIPELIARMIIPLNLSPMPVFSVFFVVAGSILFLLIILYIIKQKDRAVAFAVCWYLLFLLPSLIYKNEGIFGYQYLAQRAFVPLAGMLFVLVLISKPYHTLFSGNGRLILAGVTLLFSLQTYSYSHNFSDAVTFYSMVIRANPNAAVAHYNRGLFYAKNGSLQQAITDFSFAVTIKPDYAEAWANLSTAKEKRGDYAGATEAATRAIQINPLYHEPYYNRGVALDDMGDYISAIRDYSKTIELFPHHTRALNNRGTAYANLGKIDSAIADYNRAITIDNQMTEAYSNRGMLRVIKADYTGAIDDLSVVITRNPQDAQAYYNRGVARISTGDRQGGCNDWTKALELGLAQVKPLIEQNCR